MRFGDTPVPIPNTMVKTEAADDTMLETAWESRWLPESLKKGWGEKSLTDRTGIWVSSMDANPHQRGNAVMITGFTSDLSIKEILCLNG